MGRTMRSPSRLILSLAILLCGLQPAAASKRVALVVGNSAYVHATPLANTSNDARDIAAKLQQAGFEVMLGVDLNKVAFDAKLREFSRSLESADAALLFYAGHGLQIAGRNYLVPIDAQLERERDVEFEAVSLDFVLKQMEIDRETKTNIVFLDACRNNPLSRNLARSMGTRSTSIGSGLAETIAGIGTFISYSTQPGNVALDGDGRNSPFASALLKYMRQPGKSLTSVMIDVRKDVVAATSGKQVPWDHSALTGEFFFDPTAKTTNDAELQGRVRLLENEIKLKTESANTAANAALVQLKQRVDQMSDENRRDWDRVFQLQRSTSGEANSAKIGSLYREIGQLQIGVVRRSKQREELKVEIERLEKSLGQQTKADDESQNRGATRSLSTLETPSEFVAPGVGENKPSTIEVPETTTAAKPDVAAKTQAAAPKPGAKIARSRPLKKQPQDHIDPDWATKLFAQ